MLLTDIARRCNVTVQAVSLLLKNLAYRETIHVFRIVVPWRGGINAGMASDRQGSERNSRKKK